MAIVKVVFRRFIFSEIADPKMACFQYEVGLPHRPNIGDYYYFSDKVDIDITIDSISYDLKTNTFYAFAKDDSYNNNHEFENVRDELEARGWEMVNDAEIY